MHILGNRTVRCHAPTKRTCNESLKGSNLSPKFNDRFSLHGKLAVVTGASRGLGYECARRFAENGAMVVLVGRSEEPLRQAAERIRAGGGSAELLVGDVEDVENFTDALDSLPRIDVLLNNAGGNIPKAFVDVSVDEFDSLFRLNVKSVYFTSQAAVRKMLIHKTAGAIVNMSSQMGHVGLPNRTLYCATKHAVEGLTKALALEVAQFGIRVNCVSPTFVKTPMTEPFFADANFEQFVLSRIPLGRCATAEDVAGAALFLASEAAGSITGTSLLVDGGWTAQ